MGLLKYGKVLIHGNFEQARRYKNGRPRDWINRDYRAIVPFKFTWRVKWCGVKCDCTEVIESYQPYFGYRWSHMPDCALLKHYKMHPGWANVAGSPSPPAVEPD